MLRLSHPLTRAALLVLGYLGLALVLTWPLGRDLQHQLIGLPNVDALDTLTLRGLFARMLENPGAWPQSDGVYFPVGYPVGWLMPNLLDHLSAAPLVQALPFPLADNLWWLLVFVLNGLAAHRLGRQVGGHDGAGALMGVAWVASEPLLREANLHHAPQALMPWAPLFLAAVLRARQGERRAGLWAGLWLALSALTYWYQALFLALGAAPLVLSAPRAWRSWVQLAAVTALIAGPPLGFLLSDWRKLPLADPSFAPAPLEMRAALEPVPARLRFVVEQSSSPGGLLRPTPLDRSNRISIVLLGASFLMIRRRGGVAPGGLLALAGIGAVMSLGPYLKWGEDPILWSGHPLPLPFRGLGALHPFLERLSWPQRWGVLVPLGLGALAAQLPRSAFLTPLVLMEALWLSGNAPLQLRSTRTLEPWGELAGAPGAILELPLARPGVSAPLVGLHARLHRRPVVNPMLLPPGSSLPEDWKRWAASQPAMDYLRRFEEGAYPEDPGPAAIEALRAAGVAAIALDALPGSALTEGRILRYRTQLSAHFGPPEDRGALLVWWITRPDALPAPMADPAAWRELQRRERILHPPPELDTLIEPLW